MTRKRSRTVRRGEAGKVLCAKQLAGFLPYLSSVLNSQRAIQVNIAIIKTFVHLREALAGNAALARKLAELEGKYDQQFKSVFDAIRELMMPPLPPRRRIGFHPD